MKKIIYLFAGLFAVLNLNAQNISLTADSDTLCAGDSTMIYASNGSSYVWSPNTGLDTTAGDTVKAMPAASTTYRVIGTVGMNQDTQFITITVNQLPNVMVMTVEDSICSGSATDLIASGANTYMWSPATGLSSTMGDTVSASPGSSTNYEVVGTDTNGCEATASQSITVKASPTVNISAPQFVCVNTPTRLSVSGGQSYTWTPAPAFDKDTGEVVLITIGANTTINVTATGSNGCTASRGTLVRVNSAPAVLALEMNDKDTNLVEICEGDTVKLVCVGAGGNGTYDWTGNNLLANSGTNVQANPTVTSSYKVVGNNNGCKDSLNFTINVNPSPTISLSQSSRGAAICKDEADIITVTSNANLFRWNILGSQVVTTDKEKAVAPGITSTVVVEAISDVGCENSAQVVILVDTTCGETLSAEDLEATTRVLTKTKGKQLEWALSGEKHQNAQLMLIDLTGNLVHSTELVREELSTSPELRSGIYLIHVELPDGAKTTQKVIIH